MVEELGGNFKAWGEVCRDCMSGVMVGGRAPGCLRFDGFVSGLKMSELWTATIRASIFMICQD